MSIIVGYFVASLFNYLYWKSRFALGQLVASGSILIITWIVGVVNGS